MAPHDWYPFCQYFNPSAGSPPPKPPSQRPPHTHPPPTHTQAHVQTKTHSVLTSTVHVPTAASCICPSPACPEPFACVQPPRKYLHVAQHECTQIFAGHVPPSYPTGSYGYPHLGTLCRRLQLRPALGDPCVLASTLHTPSLTPSPTQSPTHPPPSTHTHTPRHTYTQKLKVCLRLPCVFLQPRPAATLCLPVLHPSRANSRIASTSTLLSTSAHN